MCDLNVSTPATRPIEGVSFITYPQKPDGSLWIWLDPKVLNKAISCKYYKAPIFNEISQQLSQAIVFSKLNTNNGFWSIHMYKPSPLLSAIKTHKRWYHFLWVPFSLKMSQDIFKCAWKNGLVFNHKKCSIKQQHITLYDIVFTKNGMKPDPTKVQVLQDLPTPHIQTKL